MFQLPQFHNKTIKLFAKMVMLFFIYLIKYVKLISTNRSQDHIHISAPIIIWTVPSGILKLPWTFVLIYAILIVPFCIFVIWRQQLMIPATLTISIMVLRYIMQTVHVCYRHQDIRHGQRRGACKGDASRFFTDSFYIFRWFVIVDTCMLIACLLTYLIKSVT